MSLWILAEATSYEAARFAARLILAVLLLRGAVRCAATARKPGRNAKCVYGAMLVWFE